MFTPFPQAVSKAHSFALKYFHLFLTCEDQDLRAF
jgi:hypothetical protein